VVYGATNDLHIESAIDLNNLGVPAAHGEAQKGKTRCVVAGVGYKMRQNMRFHVVNAHQRNIKCKRECFGKRGAHGK
ncbi:MAG: hypothetical protein RL137_396, partial [Bacteroidota bacterium]